MCDTDCISVDTDVHATPGATTAVSDRIGPDAPTLVQLLRCGELARVDFVVPAEDQHGELVGRTVVNAAAFRARACDIERGLITVQSVSAEQMPVPADACYAAVARPYRAAAGSEPAATATDANSLYLKRGTDLGVLKNRALVLHEMVHATQDAARLPMDVGHAEVAAYTLQAMVYVLFGSTWSSTIARERRPIDPSRSEAQRRDEEARRAIVDEVVRQAETAADELLRAGPGATLLPDRVTAMIEAIGQHPSYAGHTGSMTHLDGITPPTTAVRRHRGGRR